MQSHGYVIEQANVRFPVGEIDLLAWEGRTLCVVEVRSASSGQWGGPLGSVTSRKREHLIRAARWYLARCRQMPSEIRFDVVGIEWRAGGAPRLALLRGAFQADG